MVNDENAAVYAAADITVVLLEGHALAGIAHFGGARVGDASVAERASGTVSRAGHCGADWARAVLATLVNRASRPRIAPPETRQYAMSAIRKPKKNGCSERDSNMEASDGRGRAWRGICSAACCCR